MKLNIFKINDDNLVPLINKLKDVGLQLENVQETNGWELQFYFSEEPTGAEPGWLLPLKFLLPDNTFEARSYFAAVCAKSDNHIFIISYGKSHFYIRPFCDHNFGIEVAKRIIDASSVASTSEKFFQSKQKKGIKNFNSNAELNVAPGNSVDYVQGSIREQFVEQLGKVGKFGQSCQISVEIDYFQIPEVLDCLINVLESDPIVPIPRTEIIEDEQTISRLEKQLYSAVRGGSKSELVSVSAYTLSGVGFVFSPDDQYQICLRRTKSPLYDDLEIERIRGFIVGNKIADMDLPNVKIRVFSDGIQKITKNLIDFLEFTPDDERIVLTEGRWREFNQDYLNMLDFHVDRIPVVPCENEFSVIPCDLIEKEFNIRAEKLGYINGDRDFSNLKTKGKAPTEAWDLRKGNVLFAVKFGSASKLGYVVDQSMSVIDLLRNGASTNYSDKIEKYCLWLGFERQTPVSRISEVKSIILKQKIEAWARHCRDAGVSPQLKLCRKEPKPKGT
ncbi:DUF6119 family protein [Corynebacterium belfantii]|uniref:TIGR04141 family sporadically distributed protein n=1 Tax=Corynebacterium belfantii TaxID=2014537 RepID=A0ABS0LC96_9CORY|nr:DUF6119 family protein [Corynebacterium belfantii]MBG9346864.1 TIGR04141 family sporadically distributed protein [Corynebacterium belfantii]MBG9354246.1 TIGR04141 family sporadically distributed protein [Corynebacterium belfantii]